MKKNNVFLDATESGNALILALGILNLIGALSLYFTLQLVHYSSLSFWDHELEILKIKAIRQIKDDFYHQDCKDFTLEEENYSVSAVYDETECMLYFEGNCSFSMKIEYDDVFLCIASVEYFYDE